MGNFVIQPQFESAGNFINGLATVSLNAQQFQVDKTGAQVGKPK
jgi:hypothetical protein